MKKAAVVRVLLASEVGEHGRCPVCSVYVTGGDAYAFPHQPNCELAELLSELSPKWRASEKRITRIAMDREAKKELDLASAQPSRTLIDFTTVGGFFKEKYGSTK